MCGSALLARPSGVRPSRLSGKGVPLPGACGLRVRRRRTRTGAGPGRRGGGRGAGGRRRRHRRRCRTGARHAARPLAAVLRRARTAPGPGHTGRAAGRRNGARPRPRAGGANAVAAAAGDGLGRLHGVDLVARPGGRLAPGCGGPADRRLRVPPGSRPVRGPRRRPAHLHRPHPVALPRQLGPACGGPSARRRPHLRRARPRGAGRWPVGVRVGHHRRIVGSPRSAGGAACAGGRATGPQSSTVPRPGTHCRLGGRIGRRLLHSSGRLGTGAARRVRTFHMDRPDRAACAPRPARCRARRRAAVRAHLLSVVRPHTVRTARPHRPRPVPHPAAPSMGAGGRRRGRRRLHPGGVQLVGGLPTADPALLPGRGPRQAVQLLGVGQPRMRGDSCGARGGGRGTPSPGGRHGSRAPGTGPAARAAHPQRARSGRPGAPRTVSAAANASPCWSWRPC